MGATQQMLASQKIASGSGPDLNIFSSATDASTTPTTTRLTLSATCTGFRVWTGEQSNTEESFTLYVSKNGGSAYAVQMWRWQARIFQNATAGDTFAFGTSDGRTLNFAQMVVPTSLPTTTGTTGTANCDKAGPPLWSPSAAHITLPSTASAFQIDSDGTERIVFISEKSPNGTWTPLRWVRHSASRATQVQCNYQEVALANYAGATLAITAPTGTTIGGSNTPMALPIPAVTGTTHNVTTVANFKTAIAAAVEGDEIVLATGTYSMDVAITDASFTANEALGNQGCEGILIRGSSGTRSDVVITTNGTGTNGDWNLTHTGATAFASFKDVTFDFSTISIKFSITAGKFYFQNVNMKNGTGADQLSISNIPGALTFYGLNCKWETGGGDLFNAGSNASGTYNSTSTTQLINCDGATPSNTSASQCVTSHDGLVVALYGGTYSEANTNVLANDASTTLGYAYFVTLAPGTRAAGVANGWTLFGSYQTQSAALAGTALPAILFTRIDGAKDTSTRQVVRNSVSVKHNIIASSVGRGIHNSVSAQIIGNIVTGMGEGIRNGDAASAQSSSNINFNTLPSNTTGFNHPTTTNDPCVFNSNAAKSNTTSISCTAGSDATLTGDYNVLDPTVDADYTAGANDTTGVDAALDSDWFPTASGNCDGTGDSSKLSGIGGSDAFGFVFAYKQGVAPRGARSRPVIVSGAEIYPDFY